MRAATIAALFGEGILVTLNATKLIMYWGGYEYYNSISYHESVHKHEEISKYFLCIFRNEIPLFANIKLNLLFIYNNFLQYSTKNTNFVLVKILFMKKRNSNQKCCKFYFERIYEIIWEKHKKRWPSNGHLFGEGIFCYLLGVAKLYNVLGGVTSIIIALGHPKVCIKF